MSERTVARIRTALPQAWAALVLFVCHRAGIVLDDVDVELLVVVQPIAGAVVYDLARYVERRGFGRLAGVLLGVNRPPVYPPTH